MIAKDNDLLMTDVKELLGSERSPETRRLARILEIVQIIVAAPGRWSRRELAQRWEISERQVQKDLEVIRHGLKLRLIHTNQGYTFEEVPGLPTVAYTFAEALALLLAFQAAQQIPGVSSPDLAAAIARLQSVFPREFLSLFNQITSQTPRASQSSHRQEVLLTLNHALAEQRKVRISYRTQSRGGEVNERVIHPYHIMPYVRSWQAIAYCEKRQQVLMFKLDRMDAVTVLDVRYIIPTDFDLATYIGDTWGLLRGEASESVDVIVQFDAVAGAWVGEEIWHPSQRIEQQADGTVLFKVHIAVTAEFVNWLLYYGARVKVLEPEWLRTRVREEHRKAIEV